MKSDILLDAIGMIRDEIILDARESIKIQKENLFVKAAMIAAAVTLCVTIPVPILTAANVQPAYEVLYQILPEMAQKLKPVKMSCEDNGIKMEVISADIHENEAVIYIMLEDMTSNRLDATTDLFDSYCINTPFDCISTCSLVEYDEKTSSAMFLIQITQCEEQIIENDKLTFSVTEILSGKYQYDDTLPELDLHNMSTDPKTQKEVNLRGSSYLGEEPDWESLTYLAADGEMLYSPVEGVSITAMGFVNNQLHIQVYYEDIHRTDNHGYVYFMKDDQEKIMSEYSVGFWDEERCGSFEEYVFNLSPEDLSGYELYGKFTTCNTRIDGNWQVTFPLKTEE